VTDVNQATEQVTGLPRARLIGSSFSDYFTEPANAEAGYQKVLSEGLVQDYPLTIRHLSGRTTDVLYNAAVYRNQAGQVQGVFAAARDVTERKRAEAELVRYRDGLEELVRQRTAELEDANAHLQSASAELARSNQELEQFAYVASHDLQEPLRAVTGYLGLLEGQLAAKLDDNGRHRIAGAVQGAQRMHTLITDLLALSRVGTRGQAFEATDLNTVLDLALDSLRAGMAETGATVTRDPLPTLRADAVQMTQLFQNLIGNAIKFRGEQAPEIHVGAGRQPDRWVLSVRDNGIGIEPQYYDRIFLIFQRLHTRRLYPGTGIGLAICKKIVERHGGSICVESQPGQGSTFYFTIPSGDIS
jgi:PAS domain S-box-containing protein